MSKAEHNIVPYNKVDLSRISFTDLEDNDRIPSQRIAYVRYNDPKYGENQFDIQTPEILLDNYGIPDADGPYYQTTKQRAFFKVPLGVNPLVTSETEAEREKRSGKLQTFKNMLSEFDTFMTNKENLVKFFGSAKNAKKYTYQPFVRQARVMQDSDSDSDDEEKEVVVRPDYTKAKIPLEWNTEKVLVDVFQKNKKGTEAYETDGSHTDVEVTTLDDLKQHVRYMRKGRYVFHVAKLWAAKQPANGQTTRMYGLTFKLRRVEVQPRTRTEVKETVNNQNPFIDSDDEEEDVDQGTVKHFVDADDAVANEDSEDDSEEESEDESEEEQVVQAKTKGRKRTSKKSSKNI